MSDPVDKLGDNPEQIQQEIEVTRGSITQKLEALEEKVTSTVQNAKDTVEETITNVTSSVQDTVENVKRTFDLRHQVEQHPWAMVGGSVVVGFALGSLLDSRRAPSFNRLRSHGRPEEYGTRERDGSAGARYQTAVPAAAPAATGQASGWLGQFDDEIQKLKGMAIGYLVNSARDWIREAMPAQLRPQVDDLLCNVSSKLGGAPLGPSRSPSNGAHSYSNS